MRFEFLADPAFLFYSAMTSVVCALVVGRFTTKDLWKNVDLFYYLLGTLGAISLFVSKTLPDNRNGFLEAEYELTNRFWESVSETDPRTGITPEEWITELQSRLTPFETGVRAGCEIKGYERVCRIRDALDNGRFKLGQFEGTAKAARLEHEAACELFIKFADEYFGPALDATECVRFDRGEFADSEYLQGKYTDWCGYITKTPPFEYIEEYHPGSLLGLTRDPLEARSKGSCGKLNSFLMRREYINDQKEQETERYREAVEDKNEPSKLTSVLQSPIFAVMWPYLLILGFSLKLAKWSATTRSETATQEKQPSERHI